MAARVAAVGTAALCTEQGGLGWQRAAGSGSRVTSSNPPLDPAAIFQPTAPSSLRPLAAGARAMMI